MSSQPHEVAALHFQLHVFCARKAAAQLRLDVHIACKVIDILCCNTAGCNPARDLPEWRKGPRGPKTLCNACGLRWAKKEKKEKRGGGDDSSPVHPSSGAGMGGMGMGGGVPQVPGLHMHSSAGSSG